MKKSILSLAFGLATIALFAQKENPVKWAFSSKKINATTYEIRLSATLAPKWHIYSQTTEGDGPVPTSIVFDKNPLVKSEGAIAEQGKLKKEYNKFFGANVSSYDNRVEFVQRVTKKALVNTIYKGKITYMVCDDEKCLPPTTLPFSVALAK
jgi:Disulphide bond corrector protein DsbC